MTDRLEKAVRIERRIVAMAPRIAAAILYLLDVLEDRDVPAAATTTKPNAAPSLRLAIEPVAQAGTVAGHEAPTGETPEDRKRRLARERTARWRNAKTLTSNPDSVTLEPSLSVTVTLPERHRASPTERHCDAAGASPTVTERHRISPSDSPSSSSSSENTGISNVSIKKEEDARVTRRDAVTLGDARSVTPSPTVTERHAALGCVTPPGVEDPEAIITRWTGQQMSVSDSHRLSRAVANYASQEPVVIRGERITRTDLFSLAVRQMVLDAKQFGTLSGVLAFCASVVERCCRDGVLPGEWLECEKKTKSRTARTAQREADTDWSNVKPEGRSA